jgi:hypothetical protein
MVFRDALVAMNGCQTSEFFELQPLSLDEWTSLGPREFQEDWIHLNIDE